MEAQNNIFKSAWMGKGNQDMASKVAEKNLLRAGEWKNSLGWEEWKLV